MNAKLEEVKNLAFDMKQELNEKIGQVAGKEKPLTRLKLGYIYSNWDFFETNIKRLLDSPQRDYADTCRKTKELINAYITLRLNKSAQIDDLDLPFGSVELWLSYIEALVQLQVGIPDKFLKTYQELCNEKNN